MSTLFQANIRFSRMNLKYFRKMSDREIDSYVDMFLKDHGFNGLSLLHMELQWFDIDVEGKQSSPQIVAKHGNDPNPDIRAFDTIEKVITCVHRGGGGCHIWFAKIYNPGGNHLTSILDPELGGLRGPASKRLMRYIAARLGPLPGWSMGFSADVDYQFKNMKLDGAKELEWWRGFLKDHSGWDHVLGARTRGSNLEEEIDWDGDYVGWEDHRPSYHRFVHCLTMLPNKPHMSEDQFRMRDRSRFSFKDYDEPMTRRGLWHASMAGGVAGLWGNLRSHGVSTTSKQNYLVQQRGGEAYPAEAKTWTKTHALFFENRLRHDLIRANDLTDFQTGSDKINEVANLNCCLKSKQNEHFIFYKEDCDSVRMNLSGMAGPQPAVVVDTKAKYKEVGIGQLEPRNQTWTAPYKSDWAVAVGTWSRANGIEK